MKDGERSKKEQVGERHCVRPDYKDSPDGGVFIDSMTLINRSYVYDFASEAYCLAHGRRRGEIVGNSVASIWGKTHFNRFIKKHLDQCFAGNVVR